MFLILWHVSPSKFRLKFSFNVCHPSPILITVLQLAMSLRCFSPYAIHGPRLRCLRQCSGQLSASCSHARIAGRKSCPFGSSALVITPCPSHLKWAEGDDFDEDIAAIVWQHRPQLKHLDLYDHWWEDSEDILPSASPGQLPALETLTMRGEGCFRRYSPELLQLAPNLVECRIYFSDAFFDMGNVVLPNLRRLTFGEPGTCPRGGDVDPLKCLSLPKLEALRIGTSSGALVTFLKDSCPPLRELSIQIGDAALDFVALAEYVPLLTRLEVWFLKHLVVENLFAALTSQPLLPHLHILTIHLAPQYLPQNTSTFWTALTRALAARRTHIQVFRLTVRDRFRASQMPAPDILAAFRELAADGMHVSIGATWGKWSLFDNISLSEA
ncbi:hypothetical protein MSAN_00899100 [Mycena sanguinolenta]|uniref:Uncharacterized protein n=1 Tax=Mycena sanguinolenta TaxID=230812 RepID=A0A8H6YWC8_9AGAR|nr:hypothetical protein MSAN_00899100 [Mycena sanguinolenta]